MKKIRALSFIMMCIWLGAIWIASSLPARVLPRFDYFNIDKLIHLYVYFGLSCLVFINYRLQWFGSLSKYQLLMILVFQACLEESHQYLISNRSVSVLDLSANLMGILTGYYLITHLHRKHD